MALFNWLSRRPAENISDPLWSQATAHLPFLRHLDNSEKNDLRQLVERFLQEKEFSAGGDLQLSDEICLSIAIQGCLPILKLGLSAYQDWVGIIVYPAEFVVPRQLADDDGLVHEFDDVISGEAWEGGPLILSWQDVQMAGDGYNVVIHEFAHKLDMLNGEADGIPALHSGISEAAWISTFDSAYDDFCQRIDNNEETTIDPYASEHPAEFFAVLSECFFETPAIFAEAYPALFTLFKRYYRQDPGCNLAGCKTPAEPLTKPASARS
jgi:Mlc titration factor MtfA (ptsG expression regulator)